MVKIISFEKRQFENEVLNIYRSRGHMDNYNDNDREYIEKDVIRPMASNLEERLKEVI